MKDFVRNVNIHCNALQLRLFGDRCHAAPAILLRVKWAFFPVTKGSVFIPSSFRMLMAIKGLGPLQTVRS